MSGYAPMGQWDEAERLRKRFNSLYRLFFFPEDMTDMDKLIEYQYIEAKLEKVYSFNTSRVS